MSQEQVQECPICMEPIEDGCNKTVTQCGHLFHSSCIFQNMAAHNGFGCPYCRAAMAEEPEEDDNEDEDTWTGESYVAEEEVFDDDAMRGFRFFFNNLNGEAHDEEDVVEEENYLTEVIEDNDAEEDTNIPTVNFVAQKLQEQGVTYEQLIKLILHRDHEEYESDDAEVEQFDNELFGKIRIIVSNYQPASQDEPAVAPIPAPTIQSSEPVPRPTPALDNEAQPKTRQVRNVPAFMPHV